MKKTAPLLVNEDTTQEDGGKIEYAPMVIGEVERNGVTTSWSRIEKSNPSRRRSLQRSYNELVEVFKSPISGGLIGLCRRRALYNSLFCLRKEIRRGMMICGTPNAVQC